MENSEEMYINKLLFEIPYIKELTGTAKNNFKKYGKIGLIESVRFYVKSTNFVRNNYTDLKTKLKNRITQKHVSGERKEISKFLKTISDYKHKIREIKHKIHEEEKSL